MGLKGNPETFMRHFNFLNEINSYIIGKNGILTSRQMKKIHKDHRLPYSVFIAAKRLGYFKEIRRYNYITTTDSFSREQVIEIIKEKRLRHRAACKKSNAKKKRKESESSAPENNSKKKPKSKMKDLTPRHQKLIKAENIIIESLPMIIKGKIALFNLNYSNYLNNPNAIRLGRLNKADKILTALIKRELRNKQSTDESPKSDIPPISDEEKKVAMEKVIDAAMTAYDSYRNMPFRMMLKHDEKKIEELHSKGLIDLEMIINSEGGTLRGYISDWNKMVSDSFDLKAESKEKLKEALIDVLMEESMALTPKQRLFMTLALDLGGDVAKAFQLFSQKKSDIESFKEIQANRSVFRKIFKKLGKFKSFIFSFFKSKKMEAPQPPNTEPKKEDPIKANIPHPHFDCEIKDNCQAPNCYCAPTPLDMQDNPNVEGGIDPTDELEFDFNKIPEKEYDILSEPVTNRAYSDVDTSSAKRGRPSSDLYKKESLLQVINRIVNSSGRIFKVSEISKESNINPNKVRLLLKELVELKFVIKTGGDKTNGFEYRLAQWDDYKESESNKIEKEEQQSDNKKKEIIELSKSVIFKAEDYTENGKVIKICGFCKQSFEANTISQKFCAEKFGIKGWCKNSFHNKLNKLKKL